MEASLSKWRDWSKAPWFYPAILLLTGLLAHAYAVLSLGYYWDDWEVVYLVNTRNIPLLYGYFAFDRPFAWPYQVMYALFRLNPIAWHLVTLLMRWGGVLLLYYSLRLLWPRLETWLRWLGALLIVYPGFYQQSISAAYNRHLTAFFLFGASFFLMALAAGQPKKAWFLIPISWILDLVQVFTIEYFVGLELIRPFYLWLLFRREGTAEAGKTLQRTILYSAPYMLILGVYAWWRLVIFPTTVPTLQYAGDFKMLEDFQASFLAGLLSLLTRAFYDLIYSTLQVWLAGITAPDGLTFQSKAVWFAIAAGAAFSAIFAFFQAAEPDENEKPSSRTVPLIFGFGLWAFMVSSLPIWLTSKQLSGGGRWDDRFSLAMMTGAGLMVLAFILWLVQERRRKLLLSLLLFLSLVTQFLTVNRYRLDWAAQRDYYWQLAWRAPALQPGTAVFSLEQPSATIPGYDASFAINVLYEGPVSEGKVPYWFFTNNRFLNFDFKPGMAITYQDRNLLFTGNTSDAVSILRQGEDRCLLVLDSVYAQEPFYETGQDQLVSVSNVSRILPQAKPGTPDTQVFGLEPPHTWCYYFEKADLARQLQDWQTILSLEKQAKEGGFTPRFGPEYLPFIEAHVQSGSWQAAYELSLQARNLTKDAIPLLCSNWERFGQLPEADVKVVQQTRQTLGCSDNP